MCSRTPGHARELENQPIQLFVDLLQLLLRAMIGQLVQPVTQLLYSLAQPLQLRFSLRYMALIGPVGTTGLLNDIASPLYDGQLWVTAAVFTVSLRWGTLNLAPCLLWSSVARPFFTGPVAARLLPLPGCACWSTGRRWQPQRRQDDTLPRHRRAHTRT